MLGKFKEKGWKLPLTAHCAVHALATFMILSVFWALTGKALFWLALFDFTAHFIMDRIKASPKLLGKYKCLGSKEYSRLKEIAQKPDQFGKMAEKLLDDNRKFWYNLGIDQFVHQVTSLIIVAVMLC